MNTITHHLSDLVRPFENQWVALTPDYREVVSSGKTLDEVESHLEGNDLQRLVFFKVPRFISRGMSPIYKSRPATS
jgi:hypothetical protein